MKKYLLLLSLLALLSSCLTTNPYYQICKVSSDLPTSTTGAFESKNSACDITYNFWSEGGDISFIVTNNTNDIIYLDQSKSFLIKNGIAYDYYLNRIISSSATVASVQSSSNGATALGYWNYIGGKVPGSISTTDSSSIGSQKSASVSYEEKPIIAIPPHASKVISEYDIMSHRFEDCDLFESPSKNEQESMSFSASNTPVTFSNFLCYRVGDIPEDNYIENSFYISEVTNQHYEATIREEKMGCSNDYFKTKRNVFIKTSPKEFYIKYTPRYQKKVTKNVIKSTYKEDNIYGY
ncbi:MAG: hypothetical protein K2H61_04015 [Muribaculaceae bacterium]|nr:hypothetical protein [Muribaculaceae bacterium]